MAGDNEDVALVQANAVTLKLPNFWEERPRQWFRQVEAQFMVHKITSDNLKFQYAITALNGKQSAAVEDILETPPVADKYTALKNALCTFYQQPPVNELLAAFQRGPQGDMHPMSLLRDLNGLSKEFEKWKIALYISWLPPNIQNQILASEFATAVDAASKATSLTRNLPSLVQAVDLQGQAQLAPSPAYAVHRTTQFRPYQNARGILRARAPMHPNPPRHFSRPPQFGLQKCFYHNKYGRSARNCAPPCPMSSLVAVAMQQPQQQNKSQDLEPLGSFLVSPVLYNFSIFTALVCPITGAPLVKHKPLFLTDSAQGINFLIDSGAAVSIVPPSRLPSDVQVHPLSNRLPLQAANGLPITVRGLARFKINLGFGEVMSTFVVADTPVPLLSYGFMAENGLVLDFQNRTLSKPGSEVSVFMMSNEYWENGIAPVDDSVQNILSKYPTIYEPTFNPEMLNKHGIQHFIATFGPPTHSKPRRLDPIKLKAAKQEFDSLLKMGIIRPSSSPWASPIHMVQKSDGSWRPCGDYRLLNNITLNDKYPLPHIHDFVTELNGSKIFSKVDLVKGFFNIPVATDDIPKTAVATPFGLFEYLFLPFGLKNAPQSFQRFMHQILRDIPHIFIYMDDVLIATPDLQTHLETLDIVLNRLSSFNIAINKSKCVFAKSNIEFLGFLINPMGISPPEHRIQAIKDYPAPTNKKGLQRFLGLINFYNRFIHMASNHLKPLHTAVAKSSKKFFVWGNDQIAAFTNVKQILTHKVTLSFPDPNAPLILKVDASDVAVGAVVEQVVNGIPQPLSFMSHSLSKTQQRYSTFDRELLAAYLAIKKFKYLLEGRSFTIYTDHKPLTFALNSRSDYSDRQLRHLSYIAEYTNDIRHIKGIDNTVADSLSRAVMAIQMPEHITLEQIYNEQCSDQELQALLKSGKNSLQFDTILSEMHPRGIIIDTSTGTQRIVVPKSLREPIFKIIHNQAHLGIKATKSLISRSFIWPGLTTDITKWVKTCQPCSKNKIISHNKAIIQNFPVPKARFMHVHVDIIGPFPQIDGFKYILTSIDRYSRFPAAHPMKDMTADSCVTAFLASWVQYFGSPTTVTTDRGKMFLSNRWKQMLKDLGAAQSLTTAYHPQSNGLVERLHRTLKSSLRAQNVSSWLEALPIVMLSLRAMTKDEFKMSPAQMTFGENVRLPGELQMATQPLDDAPPDAFLLSSRLKSIMRNIRPYFSTYVPHQKISTKLFQSSFVYVRDDAVRSAMDPYYKGPYKVVKYNPKFFTLQIDGSNVNVSIDRLKPADT